MIIAFWPVSVLLLALISTRASPLNASPVLFVVVVPVKC